MSAFDIAAGVFIGGLPLVLTFMSMLKRSQGDMARAWSYGVFAFAIGAYLVAGAFDATIWN